MLEDIGPGLAPVGIPSFLFAFVFGMLVAEWTELIQSEKFNRFRSWWLVLGVALICAAPHISFHWRLVMDAISAIAILGAVVNGFSPLGNAVLSTPAARFLGKISYSFYLFHPLTLPFLYGSGAAISALLNVGLPTVAILPILLLATTLATLPLAILSYKLAEEPSMTVSRMFGSNRPLNTNPAPAE